MINKITLGDSYKLNKSVDLVIIDPPYFIENKGDA